jgi:RimJ/RimL family protein N-acetyltransferase
MRVFPAAREELHWLVERTQFSPTAGCRAIKATDEDGRIRGMVAFDGWTLNSVQAHMAVDSPIAWRALLRPAFAYPFEEAGRGVLLAIIPAGNTKSVRLAQHFGFQESHRVRDGWSVGEDLLVLEMRREACRWLAANVSTRKAA